MIILNEWLIFSLVFLLIWIVFFIFIKRTRKEMLWASIFTAPFGLTEPLFVPEYWTPPSLFNLNVLTGFDIESIIWCFAVGGIGAVLYETIFKMKHKKMTEHEMHAKRHRFHLLAILSPLIVFLILYFFTSLNPIYTTSISLFIGGIAAILCRPDLKKKVFIGGVLFLALYFVFFFLFNLAYPSAVMQFWNLSAISGILVFGIPIEELIFAFSFGMMWSSVYEHIKWYKLKEITKES